MEKVKIGIIGIGNMGSCHAKNILDNHIENLELTAVCDVDEKKLDWVREKFGDKVACFSDSDDLINVSGVQAVIIATPHYEHSPIAIAAFKKGLHVVCEKPAGVYTKQVREMNEAAKKSGKVFSMMYNQRSNPLYQKLRTLIQSGELGELKRMVWIITNWFRTQKYYDSGTWRSTWVGEGGGVLINQDPHQLDLWQWLTGMPKRIRSSCYYGKFHNIEVEDDVMAFAEYENGMTATFITSTGEAPGTNRLEISGTRGKIVVESDKLSFFRNVTSDADIITNGTPFETPEVWKCEVPIGKKPAVQHDAILQNFTNAILKGEKLIAPGEEGIFGLTISNAIHLSSWTDSWVELPLDEELFYNMLQEKIKASRKKEKVESVVSNLEDTY